MVNENENEQDISNDFSGSFDQGQQRKSSSEEVGDEITPPSTDIDADSDYSESERAAKKKISIKTHKIGILEITGTAIFESANGTVPNNFLEDISEITERLCLPVYLENEVDVYKKILLERNILIINSIDEDINISICAKVLGTPLFTSARKKMLIESNWKNEAPNAIGPLLKLLEEENDKSKTPLILCYYEKAESAVTSLLISLLGGSLAQKGNTARLKAMNAYIIYMLESSSGFGTPDRIYCGASSFLWRVNVYPCLLNKYTEDRGMINTWQSYFDRILGQNESLKSDDRMFYEYITSTLEQNHPESFYISTEHVAVQPEKKSPEQLSSILENPLTRAIIYIQCFLPLIPIREYDLVLNVLLPSRAAEATEQHPLLTWKNNPDDVRNHCGLAIRRSEDGTLRMEFRSGMVREQFRVLLEDRYMMSTESFSRNLRGSSLLFSGTHSPELMAGLFNLCRVGLLREGKSFRGHELYSWFKTWDETLRENDARGIAPHSKIVGRLLVELMITEELVPVVQELFTCLSEEAPMHFLLLEILFTVSRWFDLPSTGWLKKVINSDQPAISMKAIRLIYHNIRANKIPLAETLGTYCSWLPGVVKESYTPSEQFALGLFTDLLDDTETDSSQWGIWPPQVSVFRNCNEGLTELTDPICKIIFHPGVVQELERRLESDNVLAGEAYIQAHALYRLGFSRLYEGEFPKQTEKKKRLRITAEILFSWKISELLLCWSMILQGKSASRMHPRARIEKEKFLQEIARRSSETFRRNLLTGWQIAEKTGYGETITPWHVQEVRREFQGIIKKLSK